MKKNVLKAMSVGLSAVTIASTLSVPVYAEGPETIPEPIEPAPSVAPAKLTVSEEKIAEHSEALFNHMENDYDETDDKADGGVSEIVSAVGQSEEYDPETEVFTDYDNGIADNTAGADGASHWASEAASDSQRVYENVSALAQAEKNIGYANRDLNTAVTTSENAATEAGQIVDEVENAVGEAVVAVASESIESARVKVNNAATTVTTAKEDFQTKKDAVDAAKQAFAVAVIAKKKYESDYNEALRKSKTMAAYAKEDLDNAADRLEQAKEALEAVEEDFANTAAAALLKAEEEKNAENADYAAYVQAIIQNYIAKEGQTVTVTPIDNGDAKFEVTFTDKDGAATTVKYGYTVSDGEVEIFEAEQRYEWNVGLVNGEEKTVSVTESEIKEMLKLKSVVKRYEIKDKCGQITYKSYAMLTEEEKANEEKLPFQYVVVLSENNGKDYYRSDMLTPGFVVEKEGELVGYFDKSGKYVTIRTNVTSTEIYPVVMGLALKSDGYDDGYYVAADKDSDTKSKIIDDAVEVIKAALDARAAKYTSDGKIIYWNPLCCSWCELTNIKEVKNVTESVEIIKGISAKWGIDGRYVPYYDHYYINKETDKSYKYNAHLKRQQNEASAIASFNTKHPDAIITNQYWNNNNKYVIEYVDTKDINYNYVYDSKDDVLAAFSGWVYDNTRDEYGVATWGDYDKKIEYTGWYAYSINPLYEVTMKITKDQKEVFNTLSDLTKSVFRNAKSIFNSASLSEDYITIINNAKTKLGNINNLKLEVEAAQKAVSDAQREAERIKRELSLLENKSDVDSALKIAELERKLETAEGNLTAAEERFDTAQGQLTQAQSALAARIAALNQGGGEEERNYVYNPNVIPTIASIPAVTLPDAGVPLAAATRRVRRVAGVEEVEATEETVEETTPEETTEVTVTETEENPVVIDDEDVARAGGTQRSFFARTWWAWLLLVIAAIGGAVAYTKKKATDLK
jgi:hypothetical protein